RTGTLGWGRRVCTGPSRRPPADVPRSPVPDIAVSRAGRGAHLGAAGPGEQRRKRAAVGNRKRVAERRKTRPVVLGGLIAVVAGGAGVGAYALFGGGAAAEDDTRAASAQQVEAKTGPLSAAEVTGTAERFLTAWQQGRVGEAAALTDDPKAATALLTGYTKDARVKDVTLTPAAPAAAKVPFSVKGTVEYEETSKPLAYDS